LILTGLTPCCWTSTARLLEEHALPGAVELIRRLQRDGKPYACLTNSTSSPERIAAGWLGWG